MEALAWNLIGLAVLPSTRNSGEGGYVHSLSTREGALECLIEIGRGSGVDQRPKEDDLDAAYVSAFSALAGAMIGGFTSFGTSWLTQRAQLRHTHREAERVKLEALYNEFIAEASRLYADALSHQKDDVVDMVKLYALVGRMRLMSSRAVLVAAERIIEATIETYLAPNRSLHEMRAYAKQGGMNFLVEFGEASRDDLAATITGSQR